MSNPSSSTPQNNTAQQASSPIPDASSRRSTSKLRGLTWLVPILGLALFAAAVAVIWYRSQYPLTATRLHQARELWRQHGPASYNLLITIEGRMPGTYWIEVRHGRVVRAVQRHADGKETDILTITLPDGRKVQRPGQEWTVPGLFDWLERDLDRDLREGKAYTFVRFDARDGHPIEYVRSQSSQHYRLQVQLFPVAE